MRRHSIVGAGAVLLALASFVVPASTATAARAPFNAVGTAQCAVAGKVRAKPALKSAPRPNVVLRLVADLSCSTGTTGVNGSTVTSGHLVATSAPATRSCGSPGVSSFNAVIKWQTTGGTLIDTRVGWQAGTGTGGSRITTDLPGRLSTIVGSFGGARGTAHLVSTPTSLTRCSQHRGLKAYALDAGSSTLRLPGVDTTGLPGPMCNNGQTAPAQYQKVVVFSFENRRWADVGGVGFGSMPYMNALAQSCAHFAAWGEANPTQNSLTQYAAQITGALQPGIVNDCSPSATCSTMADNIFRQLRGAGKTGINFVEGATTGCSAEGNAAKHVPTLYMWDPADRAACNAQTRPYSEFNPNNLPDFSFITPTLCSDGHDCSNSVVDNWASTNVQDVLDSAAYQAGQVAVFIWYDEDTPVPNLQIAPTAVPGPLSTSGIGYASTLQAWESMLGLPCLADACTAPDLRGPAHV